MKSGHKRSAVVAMALIFVVMGASMAFGRTFVLFSAFSGRLVTGGNRPAAGVTLERSWKWGFNGESGSDQTVTDAEGRFAFPAVTGRSFLASLAPHEPSVRQKIVAHGPGGDVVIWDADKSNYDDNGELDGRKIDVVCALDKEPSADGLYWGTCVEAE